MDGFLDQAQFIVCTSQSDNVHLLNRHMKNNPHSYLTRFLYAYAANETT